MVASNAHGKTMIKPNALWFLLLKRSYRTRLINPNNNVKNAFWLYGSEILLLMAKSYGISAMNAKAPNLNMYFPTSLVWVKPSAIKKQKIGKDNLPKNLHAQYREVSGLSNIAPI